MTRQLFTSGADSVLRAILGGMVLAFCLFWPIRHLYVHSSYATNVGIDIPQPILFSHEHHVGRLELHCLYCHSGVEKSSFAGMP
ncbi:MAG: hypothetical protein KDD69_18680, partial [Bdellovibrionales bacterium]|nr:hypothetical protein [Bdellovibrionales bacterium]